jgi:hypothetical protein
MRMKKRILMLSALLCILLLSVNPVSAWYLELDNSDGDNEIDVWFRVENGETVNLYEYDLGFCYDLTELEYSSYTNNLPAGWIQNYWPVVNDVEGNVRYMYGLYGTHSFASALSISEDYLLGSYIMNILAGAVKDGEKDIWIDPTDGENGIFGYVDFGDAKYYYSDLSDTGQLINGTGLDLGSPVPIPGAVWLFGSGMLGLLGYRKNV